MTRKTLITSALPYANGAIHIGHLAGNNLPADVYARFCRLRGDAVHFICGSDEYGMAVALSAQLAGRTPQEHVDHFHALNQRLFERMEMSWDHYSRTTWKGHGPIVQQFFTDLLKNGYIEEKWSDQLYSASENRFLADRYVVGTCPKCGFDGARGDECQKCSANYEALELKHPKSKLTGAPLEPRATKHWFLRLDLFKQPLLKWLETKSWKPNVMNFIKAYIDDLRPRAITRDSDWGVPVPLAGAEGKVLYVWFDAPIGYISASMEWAQLKGTPEKWKEFWLDEHAEFIEFMGKDNITFHAVVFPSMIMGQDLPLKLVDAIPANEFYNIEGHKISKSDGWSIDLEEFLNRYDAESLRYMLAATAPENSDSEFSWSEFQQRVNSELVGKWGNFIHRTLTFVQKMQASVPDCLNKSESDGVFEEELEAKLQEIAMSYSEYKLRRASQLIMEMAQLCNAYFDAEKPWVLLKEASNERLQSMIHLCLKGIQHLAVASCPIIPSKAQKAWEMIGMPGTIESQGWSAAAHLPLQVGASLPVPELLFTKIEDETISVEKAKLLAQVEALKPVEKVALEPFVERVCSIDEFLNMDLRCGLVLEASSVPKSKKLLCLKVDLGEARPRQILSGIAEHYKPESLVGKKVICLVNLPRAKIMGHDSEGMILSAGDGRILELPHLEKIAPGSRLR